MIIYEDNDIIVCHKPAGVPVQSASVRTKDMVSILQNHLQEEKRDVYVVHRLDQPVEGVMVFAKTKRAAADLSRQAAGDGMKKRYHAVVEMTERAPESLQELTMQDNIWRATPLEIADAMGAACVLHQKTMQDNIWHTLVDYLVKDGRNNRSFVSEAGKKDAKRAELRYRILKVRESERLALAEIELMTGRHHQIRMQMAHAGMPLYGDQKYNPGYAVGAESGRSSLALCAVSLTFRHPSSQKEMTFTLEPKAEIFREMI